MAQQVNAEVDALLSQARRYEDKGDFRGAVRRYQAAIDLLAPEDPQRDQIQSVVDFITQTQLGNQAQDREMAQAGAMRRSAIPLWLWTIAGVGTLLAICLLSVAGYYALNRQSLPIPRISGLAPTRPVSPPTPTTLAAAPTIEVIPPGQFTPVMPAQATGPIQFQELFNSPTLDPARWQVDNAVGTQVQAGGGLLTLSSSTSHEPYIHSAVNPFPTTGDFRADLRFRFPEVGTCGTAIAMSSFALPAGRSQNETNQLSRSAELAGGISIWFWQGVIYYRSGSAFEDIAVPGNPADWRDVSVEYRGNVYRILVNGTSLYTSPPTNARPNVLWMGLPFDLGAPGCAWDSLQVTQIQVHSLP